MLSGHVQSPLTKASITPVTARSEVPLHRPQGHGRRPRATCGVCDEAISIPFRNRDCFAEFTLSSKTLSSQILSAAKEQRMGKRMSQTYSPL